MIVILLEMVIGFAGGIVIGTGFIAFIMVLGIIPRLVHISNTYHVLKVYSAIVIVSTQLGTYLTFGNVNIQLPSIFLSLWGILHGIFIGMIIAALTEVLNVFPILSKRIGMARYLLGLFTAIVLGKIFGSLFQWLIFIKY